MSETVSLHLVRPYASEDELIAAESWAVDRKGMVLIGQDRLPSGTLVRFELLLEDGQRVLVAEGKAVGYAKPDGDRPGGAKVRFKRFNAAGKAFVERALAAKAGAQADAVAEPAPTEPQADAAAEPAPTEAQADATPPAEPASAEDRDRPARRPAVPPTRAEGVERSGIRQRAVGPVAPPENRDELLEKLRERARLAKAREADAADRNQSA